MLAEPIANSSRLVLPSITAPPSRSLPETVDSYCGLKPSRIFDAAVVCTPSVQNRSLIATGAPSIGPRTSPLARRASEALARSSATSGQVTMKALRSLRASIAERNASVSSTEV